MSEHDAVPTATAQTPPTAQATSRGQLPTTVGETMTSPAVTAIAPEKTPI